MITTGRTATSTAPPLTCRLSHCFTCPLATTSTNPHYLPIPASPSSCAEEACGGDGRLQLGGPLPTRRTRQHDGLALRHSVPQEPGGSVQPAQGRGRHIVPGLEEAGRKLAGS